MIWNLLATVVLTVATFAYLLIDRHLPMLVAARRENRPLLPLPRLFGKPRTGP